MRTALSRLEKPSAALCLAGAAALFSLPVANPDLFWHLSAGRWIVRNLAVPRADWLSSTMAGKPWTDFEWLTQLLWYGALKAFGPWGLWGLKAALLAACAWALWRALGLYSCRPAARGFAVLWWALGSFQVDDLRPDNFSVLFFLLLWGRLEAGRLAGDRAVSRGQGAAAVALFAVWANLHAGFVWGLLLLGVYAFARAARGGRRDLAGLTAACAAAALLNPYGWQVYSVAWRHRAEVSALAGAVQEWRAPVLWLKVQWPLWGAMAAAFGAVLTRHLTDRDVPAEHLAVLSVFALLASRHERMAVYLMSVAVPVAARALAAYRPAEARPRLRAALLAAGMAAAGAFLCDMAASGVFRLAAFDGGAVPGRLTAFLERERAAFRGRRLYNVWHWGGYLGYRLDPDVRVFFDGRYIFHGLLAEVLGRPRGEAWTDFLGRYGVEAAVVERERGLRLQAADGNSGLQPAYLADYPEKDWALLYWDQQGMVLVRRAAFPKDWVSGLEFRWFRPDDPGAVREGLPHGARERALAKAELERFVGMVRPDDPERLRALALLARDAGF